ncbi:hypothetical protein BC941DRAFT_436552 [Chlamydoabsidia padenii]|nr:hypothetical protein BC941DRAFT_436552 [Chlamydoabsidia padenii]
MVGKKKNERNLTLLTRFLKVSSLPLGIMAAIALFILLILVLVGLCYLCCCCSCCCPDHDEEERQELLRDRSHYLRRSSTYYQWNRPPPPSTAQFKHQPQPQQPRWYGQPLPDDGWESRRTQLLKKYARDPPPSQ